MVREHAEEQGYVFFGPVEVSLEEASDLDTGLFRVRSDVHSPPRRRRLHTRRARARANQQHAGLHEQRLAAIELDGRRFRLQQASTTDRAGSDCDIRIDDPGVSRPHARIDLASTRRCVVDLGSTNGTWVDGAPVQRGDAARRRRLALGSHDFVVRLGQGPHPVSDALAAS